MLTRRHSALFLSALVVLLGSAGILSAQNKGMFLAAVNYPEGGIQPIQVAVGDFNGDGNPDVVVADLQSSTNRVGVVRVFLNNGDGTFQRGIIYANAAPLVQSLAVGDFNGDGKLDVAVVSDCLYDGNCSSGSVLILLGNGDGTFTSKGYYPTGGTVLGPNTIAVGDFNGDGRSDLVVALGCADSGCSQGAIKIFAGNGDGTFQPPSSFPTSGGGVLPVVARDFNKDGKLDVVVTNPYVNGSTANSSLTVCFGNGDGTLFGSVTTLLPDLAPVAITVGDFNADGNWDIAFTGNTQMAVMFGDGLGGFQSPTLYSLTTLGQAFVGQSIVSADMDGDGTFDLAVAGQNSPNGALLFINDGKGNFGTPSVFKMGGWNYASLAVADFNGDGKNDIALTSGCSEPSCSYDGVLSVLLGNGDGTMRATQYLTGVSNETVVASGDFNADGIPDLVIPNCISSGCSGFSLFIGNGDGKFQAPLEFASTAVSSASLVVADFNRDGRPDVAVLNGCLDSSCSQSAVSIFLNSGNATFQPSIDYGIDADNVVSIVAGDFNGDGNPDIAVLERCADGSCPQGSVLVLLGNGDGTFQPAVRTVLSAGISVSWMAAADFNGDGKTDLMVAETDNGGSNPTSNVGQPLISNGDGTFQVKGFYGGGGFDGVTVALGDLNGDGKTDIVFANRCEQVSPSCANGSLGVWLGNGDGSFRVVNFPYLIPDGNLYGVSLADVNNDGKLDVVASTLTGLSVSFGNGDGTFQPAVVYAGLWVKQNVQLAIADLNGDGGLDIVQPGFNGQLAILFNQGFGKVDTVVALQSSVNPSVSGKAVSFTRTVSASSGTPTGKVTFRDGSTVLATVTIKNGTAKYTTTKLPAGANSITATYLGDANDNGSKSALLNQFVLAATTTTITSSPNPSAFGQTVTITAAVTSSIGAPPDGESLTFKQGAAVVGTATLTGGSASITISSLGTGTRTVKAIYAGDANFAASTSKAIAQLVDKAGTTTTLTSSLNPSTHGQSVTLAATVAPPFGGTPTGTVTFVDGTTTLKTVLLNGGGASFTTSKLSSGSHSITANYRGNTNFSPSSGALTQSVN